MEEEELCIVCHKNKCVEWCFWCQECLNKEADKRDDFDMNYSDEEE